MPTNNVITIADLFQSTNPKPAGKIKLRILRMIRTQQTGYKPGWNWTIDFHAEYNGRSEFGYLIIPTVEDGIPSPELIADHAIRENPCVDRDTLIRFVTLYYEQQRRGGSTDTRLIP
jgi:hypothetical protein